MGERSGFGRLLSWWRRGQTPEALDPADVGTAFGMELRLDADDEAGAAKERAARRATIANPRAGPTQRPR